jgi:hypothetical protein
MVILPDFAGSRCVYFQACGHLPRATTGEASMISILPTNAGRAYLRFIGGGTKKNHFHVDIALAKIFPRGEKPEPTAKTQEVLQHLELDKGKKLKLLVVGQYVINLKEINASAGVLSGSRSLVSGTSEAVVEVDGARLTIKNDTHIEGIRWDVFGEGVLIDVFGSCELKIADDYLMVAFSIVQKGFNSYILGKVAQ